MSHQIVLLYMFLLNVLVVSSNEAPCDFIRIINTNNATAMKRYEGVYVNLMTHWRLDTSNGSYIISRDPVGWRITANVNLLVLRLISGAIFPPDISNDWHFSNEPQTYYTMEFICFQAPTTAPSAAPTTVPTKTSNAPSHTPTTPSHPPSNAPTTAPTTPSKSPSNAPSFSPTASPTFSPNTPTKSPTTNGMATVSLKDLSCCDPADNTSYTLHPPVYAETGGNQQQIISCCYPDSFSDVLSSNNSNSSGSTHAWTCPDGSTATVPALTESTYIPDVEAFCGITQFKTDLNIPQTLNTTTFVVKHPDFIGNSTPCECNITYPAFNWTQNAKYECTGNIPGLFCSIPTDITGYVMEITYNDDLADCRCRFDFHYLDWYILNEYMLIDNQWWIDILWTNNYLDLNYINETCVEVRAKYCNVNHECEYSNSYDIIDTAMGYFQTGNYFPTLTTECYCYEMVDVCIGSNEPTLEPTLEPTDHPVTDSSLPPDKYRKTLLTLTTYYQYTAVGVIAFLSLLSMAAWVDAKKVRINDYFKVGAILAMAIQTSDMLSDCFFVTLLSVQNKIEPHNTFYKVILYLSIVFIVVPAFISLFQLYFCAKNHWIQTDHIRSWLSKFSTVLLIVSVFTGSSFSAVALFNSSIFRLGIFNMGLTSRELNEFFTKRMYSVVILENLPQLCLQGAYVANESGFDAIAISSMIFSFISIIVSLLSMTLQQKINKNEGHEIISMNITGDCIAKKASKCRTIRCELQKRIAFLMGVEGGVIEIVKPKYITNGFELTIHVYNDKSYKQILLDANRQGKLSKIFKDCWQLSDEPKITNIISLCIASNAALEQIEMVEMAPTRISTTTTRIANARQSMLEPNGIEQEMMEVEGVVIEQEMITDYGETSESDDSDHIKVMDTPMTPEHGDVVVNAILNDCGHEESDNDNQPEN